jgi:hypothetical protein
MQTHIDHVQSAARHVICLEQRPNDSGFCATLAVDKEHNMHHNIIRLNSIVRLTAVPDTGGS